MHFVCGMDARRRSLHLYCLKCMAHSLVWWYVIYLDASMHRRTKQTGMTMHAAFAAANEVMSYAIAGERGVRSGDGRQGKKELCAAIRFGLGPNATAMTRDNALHTRQTDTDTVQCMVSV